MLRQARCQLAGSIAMLCAAMLCTPLSAHPGHDITTNVPLTDLTEAARNQLQQSRSHLRIIQHEIVESSQPNPGLMLSAFTGLLISEPVPGPISDMAAVFSKFEHVKTRRDQNYLYVESDGLPDHPMMKGITAWQQHVPLPQPYFGDNAWRIPLHPTVANTPTLIQGRFLRGAVALAVNGIPIFNPQNNRGEISQEIGELDEWGGHCGRGDDYHYHITPLHLQEMAGKGKPIAYALDGYPIYGLTEPDGSPIGTLDECHGHSTSVGYHYHAATKYPYVMAGFHGEVTERGGQVDPQPHANPIRGAMNPLRGATVLGLKSIAKNQNELTYEIGGHKGYVRYTLNRDGSYSFQFETPDGQKQDQTFQRRGGNRATSGQEVVSPRVDAAQPPLKAAPVEKLNTTEVSDFKLVSSVVADGGPLPIEFTGDGAGATPPLEWKGAPSGTKSYAIIMHHIPGPGDLKWYWVLYNIPADTHGIPKNVTGVGTLGTNSVKQRIGYAPPHSKGPGAKAYILTVYALSAPPKIQVAPDRVDRATLLAAMKDQILASAELKVTYDRTSVINGAGAPSATSTRAPADNNRAGGKFHLFPRFTEEKLDLTDKQKQSIAELETATKAKLEKILTLEQIKVLGESRPPAPPN